MKKLLFISLTMIALPMFTQPINLNTNKSIHTVVLAAGQGSRFKTGITKLIAPICGQPLVVYTCKLMEKLGYPTTAVIGYQKEKVQSAIKQADISNMSFAEQKEQLGTGHALLASKESWTGENILVLNGDMPLIAEDIINQIAQTHFDSQAAITIAVSYNIDPANAYGRIVESGDSIKIIEKKHFTYSIKDYPYVNVGVYLINRSFLDAYLNTIKQNSVSKEFYITDLVEIASENKLPVKTVVLPFDQFYGVNTFQELSYVESAIHDSLIKYWNDNGVRFILPNTIMIDKGVKIGKGTVVHPGAQLLGNTHIGEFCTIEAGAVIKNGTVGNGIIIGAHAVVENQNILQHVASLDRHCGTVQSALKNVQPELQ